MCNSDSSSCTIPIVVLSDTCREVNHVHSIDSLKVYLKCNLGARLYKNCIVIVSCLLNGKIYDTIYSIASQWNHWSAEIWERCRTSCIILWSTVILEHYSDPSVIICDWLCTEQQLLGNNKAHTDSLRTSDATCYIEKYLITERLVRVGWINDELVWVLVERNSRTRKSNTGSVPWVYDWWSYEARWYNYVACWHYTHSWISAGSKTHYWLVIGHLELIVITDATQQIVLSISINIWIVAEHVMEGNVLCRTICTNQISITSVWRATHCNLEWIQWSISQWVKFPFQSLPRANELLY